jgi:hypothetical protein
MLIRLFQQATISSMWAWHAQRFRRTCVSSVGRELHQAYLNEIVFRHSRRKQPTVASQTLLGLGTKHKSMTYKNMRCRWTFARHRATANPNILWLAETTG